MALESLFAQIKAARDAVDNEAIANIVESAKAAGYDETAFKRAYKEWERTGQVVEPTPLKQIAQGAQLGFSDELAGLGSAVGKYIAGDTDFAENYRTRRDAERASLDLYQKSNPGRSAALQMAGGLVVPVKGSALQGTTAAQRVGQGAKLGATYGGIGGLGMGEGSAADQAVSTVGGAAVGGLVGGAVSGGVEAARSGAAALVNRGRVAVPGSAAPVREPSLVPDDIPAVTPTRDITVNEMDSAKRQLLAALLKDGMILEDAKAEVARRALNTSTAGNVPITLADIAPAGGATQRLARGARVNAPAAAGRVDAFLSERDRMQGARMRSGLDVTSGLPAEAPFKTQERLIAQGRAQSGPVYDEVRQAGAVDIGDLSGITELPAFKSAVRKVQGFPDMRGRGVDDAAFLDAVYKELNATKRQLQDAVASRSGNANEMDVARVEMVMGPIRDTLNKATGGKYSEALNLYRGPAELAGASRSGEGVFSKSAETIKAELSDLATQGERDMYRAAAADSIRQKLRSMGYNRDAVKAVFNNDEIVDKLRLIFDNDAQFKAFESLIKDEARMVGTKQVLTGNSQTADKLRDAMDAGGYLDVIAGATGDPTAAAAGVARKVMADRLTGMLPGAEAKGEGILSMVLNPDTQANLNLIDELIRLQQQQGAITAGSAAAQRPLISGLTAGGQSLLPR